MKKLLFLLVLGAMVLFAACSSDNSSDPVGGGQNEEQLTIETLDVPPYFDYETRKEVEIAIDVDDLNGDDAEGVRISIYKYSSADRPTSENTERLFTGITDASGEFRTTVELPNHITQLWVKANVIGVTNVAVVPIVSGEAYYNFGPLQTDASRYALAKKGSYGTSGLDEMPIGTLLSSFGDWDEDGRPDYLDAQQEIFTEDFTDALADAFPAWDPQIQYHDEWILGENTTNHLTLTSEADVYVSFICSGGGVWIPDADKAAPGTMQSSMFVPQANDAFGMWVKHPWDENEPPYTDMEIIFPNLTPSWMGGGLDSGDRVHLGNFNPETEIHWWNGVGYWDYDGNVDAQNGDGVFYSTDEFNDDQDLMQPGHDDYHRMIMLVDAENERLILALENDGWPYSDWDTDYADAFLAITVEPWSAVNFQGLPVFEEAADSDEDGVNDMLDEFDDDPTRAFNNYFPGEDTFGRIAFEDLWPNKGDYDFNDLVMSYNFSIITSAQNYITAVEGSMQIQAVGASYNNGFAMEMMGVTGGDIDYVSGTYTNGSVFSLDAKGLENSENQWAIIPIFDRSMDVVQPAGSNFINTEPGSGQVTAPMMEFEVELLGEGVNPADIPNYYPLSPPFNPFLVINGDRSKEVHLAGNPPTIEANTDIFGQGDDNSSVNPNDNRYYVTENWLPWAIIVPDGWKHMIETVEIPDGYTYFAEWAESGGDDYEDWYLDQAGYSNPENLWQGQ